MYEFVKYKLMYLLCFVDITVNTSLPRTWKGLSKFVGSITLSGKKTEKNENCSFFSISSSDLQ
jgi:hypothetical protein